jgi:glutamyl-tRNA synthetase
LDADALGNLTALAILLENLRSWDNEALEASVRDFAEANAIKLGQIAQPLRAALSGSTVSPGIFEVMVALKRDETLARIRAAGKP